MLESVSSYTNFLFYEDYSINVGFAGWSVKKHIVSLINELVKSTTITIKILKYRLLKTFNFYFTFSECNQNIVVSRKKQIGYKHVGNILQVGVILLTLVNVLTNMIERWTIHVLLY